MPPPSNVPTEWLVDTVAERHRPLRSALGGSTEEYLEMHGEKK